MKNKKSLLIIFMTVFIDLVGFGIIIPLSPYLARDFGADAFQIGLLMSIYSLMQFLFSPFWGQLSDNYGRRPIILLSLFGAAAGHLLFAFSESVMMLFMARAIAGFFGANISTAMAYIADVTDEKERSKGMGLIGAAFGLGFVLGPAIGAYGASVGGAFGDLPPFGESFAATIASGICFVNFLAALKFLPESLDIKNEQRYRQKKARWILFTKHIKKPIVGRLMLTFFLLTLAMAHMEASLFLYVQDLYQWDLKTAGLGFAYVGLIMVFTQGYLIRKWLPKFGEKRLLLAGLVLTGLSLIGIGFVGSVYELAVYVTFLALGTGIANPSLSGSISLLTDASEQGGVMGVNHSLSALARILGPALGGWFYRDISIESPFIVGGFFALLGLVIMYIIRQNLPQSAKISS